jgi:hypothetical protein
MGCGFFEDFSNVACFGIAWDHAVFPSCESDRAVCPELYDRDCFAVSTVRVNRLMVLRMDPESDAAPRTVI